MKGRKHFEKIKEDGLIRFFFPLQIISCIVIVLEKESLTATDLNTFNSLSVTAPKSMISSLLHCNKHVFFSGSMFIVWSKNVCHFLNFISLNNGDFLHLANVEKSNI